MFIIGGGGGKPPLSVIPGNGGGGGPPLPAIPGNGGGGGGTPPSDIIGGADGTKPGKMISFDFSFRKDKQAEESKEARAKEANKSQDLI